MAVGSKILDNGHLKDRNGARYVHLLLTIEVVEREECDGCQSIQPSKAGGREMLSVRVMYG